MRIRTLKVLTMILALALATQPLQAFACDMEQNQHQHQHGDHSTMQMDHGADAGTDCCDPENSDTRDDCARMMGCGTCVAGNSIVSPLAQAALASAQVTIPDIGSGILLPSHASPPYHPPIS